MAQIRHVRDPRDLGNRRPLGRQIGGPGRDELGLGPQALVTPAKQNHQD